MFLFFSTLTIRAEKHHFPDRCATVFHWRHAPAIVVYCIHTHTRTHWNVCWPHTLKQNGHYWPFDVVFFDFFFFFLNCKVADIVSVLMRFDNWTVHGTLYNFGFGSVTIGRSVRWRIGKKRLGPPSSFCQFGGFSWICGRTINRVWLPSKDVR